MNDLTEQQELFSQCLAIGMSQYLAHKTAYPNNMTKETRYVAACQLANNNKVIIRVAELKKELNDLKLWERADALIKLKEIIEDDNSLDKDKIAAIKEANNICGFNIDKKQIDNNIRASKDLNDFYNEQ